MPFQAILVPAAAAPPRAALDQIIATVKVVRDV
jgi:hypothetical protein